MAKLTQNESLIIDAIKNGNNTIETITAHTGLTKNVTLLVCGSLCRNLLIRKNPNEKTFSISDFKQKNIIVCYGNLLMPVKIYTNKTGQRYAIRGGTWNPIGDINENEIEWIDDSESLPSNKSNNKPKDRSALVLPTIKITSTPPFEKWKQLTLTDKQHTASHIMVNGDYRIKLDILESRGNETHIKAMIKIRIGKIELPYHPSINPEFLIETKTLLSFLKGNTNFPLTIENFVWKDPKNTVYFPIKSKTFPDSSIESEMISFKKTKNTLEWNVSKYTCGSQAKQGKFSKISDGAGTVQDAVQKHKITNFIKAIEGFKINKK